MQEHLESTDMITASHTKVWFCHTYISLSIFYDLFVGTTENFEFV